ncbi:hypothetical protein HGI30_20650 [Paenibacillus albicereus]|uniref:Copper amine oxidase-like N-terminal domain-containing protein n=1 Tax=Paenibacillus albicereus TaxID=2726185 RepID=A0A6H2H219_9BACL|nr:hypothetical protein [Paenibacillus albicereus]QJC53697.1 hypothetical protein HGI30_20650 [Paenibacillus albicereus]
MKNRLLPARAASLLLAALMAATPAAAASASASLPEGAGPAGVELLESTSGPTSLPDATASLAASSSTEASVPHGWSFHRLFYDEKSGRSYFTAFRSDSDTRYESVHIYQDKDESWHALEKGIQIIWSGYDGIGAMLILPGTYGGATPLIASYLPDEDRAIVRAAFSQGDRGIAEIRSYATSYRTEEGYSYRPWFLSFYRTPGGLVREVGSSTWRSRFHLLPDGGQLVQAYSEQAKQYEVFRLDPDTGNRKHLVYARLDAYDAKAGKAVVRYNKPDRPAAILDLASDSLRPPASGEIQRIRSDAAPAAPYLSPSDLGKAMPPADLQPQELPVTATKLDVQPVARAVLAPGIGVDLPFAFIRGGRTLLPARELIDAAGLQVEAHQIPGTTGIGNWFELTGPAGTVRADSESSLLLADRLYVSSALLQRIGLAVERIDWLPPSAD